MRRCDPHASAGNDLVYGKLYKPVKLLLLRVLRVSAVNVSDLSAFAERPLLMHAIVWELRMARIGI